jgi:hypothetical protein
LRRRPRPKLGCGAKERKKLRKKTQQLNIISNKYNAIIRRKISANKC